MDEVEGIYGDFGAVFRPDEFINESRTNSTACPCAKNVSLLIYSFDIAGLTRVKDLRYPELHLREHPRRRKSDPESNGTPNPDRGQVSPASKGRQPSQEQGVGNPLPGNWVDVSVKRSDAGK